MWHPIATMCWYSAVSLLLLGVNSKLGGFCSLKFITSQSRFLKSTDFSNANSSISPFGLPRTGAKPCRHYPLGVGGQGWIVVLEMGCLIEGPQNGFIKDLFEKGVIAVGYLIPPASSSFLSWARPHNLSPKKPSGKSLKLAAQSHSPSSVLSVPGVSPGQPSKLRATAAFHLADLHALPPPGRIQVLDPSLSTDAGFSSTTDLLCDVGQPPPLSKFSLSSVAFSSLY